MPEAMTDTTQHNSDWHLDKNVSLSVIVLLIINLATTAWWAATLTGDVDSLKARPDLTERVIRLEAVNEEQRRVMNHVADVLGRLDTTIDRISESQLRLNEAIASRNGSR